MSSIDFIFIVTHISVDDLLYFIAQPYYQVAV